MKRVLLALALSGIGLSSQAQLVDLGPGSFMPTATAVTFDEVPLGTSNPTYTFSALAGLGDVTVSFGGFFVGQAGSGGFPVTLSDTTPTGPLALDPAAPVTFITTDNSNPSSPVLSGTPTFNGPVSVLFSVPVAAVGLAGGFFDSIGSTTIEAYDVNGHSLGSIVNSKTGIEFYGLADVGGANVISGISFYITGAEAMGFAIDNLTFGTAGDVVIPGVPEPDTYALMLGGLATIGFMLRRRLWG